MASFDVVFLPIRPAAELHAAADGLFAIQNLFNCIFSMILGIPTKSSHTFELE